MSLKIITHWEEGLGTVAKGVMADTQEDYAILHAFLIGAAEHRMNMLAYLDKTGSLQSLLALLLKNPPAPPTETF